MTFLELWRICENLSPDELSQQVTVEEDGHNYPLYVCNEGQGNIHFVHDYDAELHDFFKGGQL